MKSETLSPTPRTRVISPLCSNTKTSTPAANGTAYPPPHSSRPLSITGAANTPRVGKATDGPPQ